MSTADTEVLDRRTGRSRAEVAAETRAAILEAACRAIAEFGFEKIRMRMVAQEAGVSTAALHYHFDTRENLFAEALRYSFDSTGADVYEAKGDTDSSTARLARIVAASLPSTTGLRQEWSMWMELWCRAARDAESRALAGELYRRHQGWIEEALAAGVESGEFARCDTTAHARLISSICDGYGVQLMIGSPGLTLETARQAIWSAAAGPLGIDTTYPGQVPAAKRGRA